MASQISPGVNVSEIDLTTSVPALSTTQAGYVGQFSWGPLNQIVQVVDETDLINKFRKPDSSSYLSFYVAASFLAYANTLNLVRVADEDLAKNATSENTTGGGSTGTGILIKNDDDYDANYADGSGNVGQWAAKHPGKFGNNLKVSVCPSSSAYQKTLTGTLSSSGTAVTGSSTAFTTELVIGSKIVHPTTGEEKKVTAIASNTACTIESAFSTALSSAASVKARWEYYSSVNVAPGTSAFASNRSGVNDQMHVVVVDATGEISGTADTVIEKFLFVSKASDAKLENGQSNYYVNVINRTSQWIRWMDHNPSGTNWGSTAAGTTFTAVSLPSTFRLAGGADGDAIGDADKINGYALFLNEDAANISLLIGGEASSTVAQYLIGSIAEVKKDCVVFLSPEFDDVVSNAGNETDDIIAFRNTLSSSSYAFLDSNWKLVLDRHNDTKRWIPVSGDMAGLAAATDNKLDPWFAFAGTNRGILKNCIKLAWNPQSKAIQERLYSVGVNPVVLFNGIGNVLFGNKTLLSQPSAFDRINVRRLFIVLEKTISQAAKTLLFEQNDPFTRAHFKNIVEPFLRDVQARRGVYDAKVVCDESNNTGEVVDRNQFIGDIYIKPTRTAEYIQLNFVAVRTNVDFNVIVGQF